MWKVAWLMCKIRLLFFVVMVLVTVVASNFSGIKCV